VTGRVGFIPALKREAFSSILRKSRLLTYPQVPNSGYGRFVLGRDEYGSLALGT
jgi:hypothetical protein